jgi:hypothetical protein
VAFCVIEISEDGQEQFIGGQAAKRLWNRELSTAINDAGKNGNPEDI